MAGVGQSRDPRILLQDLERVKVLLTEAATAVDTAQQVISEQQTKLYDRERYVQSLEARLLELAKRNE